MGENLVDNFVHLHNHDEYSMLDGAADTDKLVLRASELGQPAIAQTNHGNLFGSYRFYKSCKTNEVTPIIGLEAYVAPESRTLKEKVKWGNNDEGRESLSGGGSYTHLTLLSTGSAGARSLSRLSTLSFTEGFYSKPRIDLELLGNLQEGLIVGSGCLSGELLTRLSIGQTEEADRYVRRMKDVFGDKFFIEVMDHDFERETKHLAALYELARTYNVRLVATNDSHYITRDDSLLHDAMLCLQTFSTLTNPKRMSFDGSGYYLKSRMEMDALSLPRQALDNTLWVAEQVGNYEDFFCPVTRMPYVSATPDADLWELIRSSERYRGDEFERAKYEHEVISSLQFSQYFLVLHDITNWARNNKIRIGPGRGSAGGSLVAYLLGITDLDPISLGLSFERFLNADRVSPPDIDIDVDDSKRDQLLNYVREKFGEDYCANICTIGTIGAKKALRDSARVLGRPYEVGTRLTWALPRSEFGRMPLLSEADLSKVDDREVFDLACRLEGLARSSGVHAAGFVVSPVPLKDLIPLYEPQRGKVFPTTQWDGKAIEELGFVKMDFLGLKNLGIIDDTIGLLSQAGGGMLVSLPTSYDDPRTFQLLQSGHTTGVFQLDSPGMQRLLKMVGPNTLADIAAVLALYRPGPMGVNAHRSYADRKNGKAQVQYPHREFERDLADILRPTFGLLVYQEQVMSTLQAVAGYTANQSDLVRRAMGKKDRVLLASEYKRFHDGCKANGYSDVATQTLWDTLVPFADYSFNKSHAIGYGVVSYWTAWLKANYPKEYMCSVLSRENDPDKLPEYINECTRMGLSVLPPSVNAAAAWSTDPRGIRYGLTSIKGCGEKAVAAILRGSPYKDWADYLRRVPKTGLNVGVVEALGLSGALDCLGSREAIMDVYKIHCDRATTERGELARGERGFGVRDRYELPPRTTDYTARAKGEATVLGVELSSSPLVVRANPQLAEGAWEYLRRVSESRPGNALLTVRCGPWELDTGYHVDQAGVRRSLVAAGFVVVD